MKYEVKLGTVCNNNCVFCLNENRSDQTSMDHILSELDRCVSDGITHIQLTGGETTLRRDFFKIAAEVKRRGLQMNVQTNGRAFCYEEICDNITRLGNHHFLISLHAHEENLNAQITGVEGAFNQTKKGINNLLSRGHHVDVNVVVNALNAPYLVDIARHHSKLGVGGIQFSWTRRMGKVRNNPDLIPRYSEYTEKLAEAADELTAQGVRTVILGVPPCVLPTHYHLLGNAYTDAAVFSGDKTKNAAEHFSDIHKMKTESCLACSVQMKCDGFFIGYAEQHGISEFKPLRLG